MLRATDLTGNLSLLNKLLDDHTAWRERLVQDFVFAGDTTEVRVQSRYQMRFTREFLSDTIGDWLPQHGRLVLPLGAREKSLLLNVKISGPAGSAAALLSRRAIAELQAGYLLALLNTHAAVDACRDVLAQATQVADDPRFLTRLLEEICRFTPHQVKEHIAQAESRCAGIAQYLHAAPGSPRVDPGHVRRWLEALTPAADATSSALNEPSDRFSSAETPLFVIPNIGGNWTREAIDGFVDGYLAILDVARRSGAHPFLVALAEYGRRHEIMVETTVPLLEPFSIHLTEDRSMNMEPHKRTAHSTMALRDARTIHVEARIEDHSVRFAGSPVVRTPDGREFPPARNFDGWRATEQTLSLYSKAQDFRYAELVTELQPAALARLTAIGFVALNFIATLVLALAPRGPLYMERLGILVVPTTLAAAVVLSREQSALSAQLLVNLRRWLGVSISCLWLAALGEILWWPVR